MEHVSSDVWLENVLLNVQHGQPVAPALCHGEEGCGSIPVQLVGSSACIPKLPPIATLDTS